MSTVPALIAARPWTDSGAIAGLFDAAAAASARLGGTPVRVLPEQLVRRASTGERQQSIRLEIGEFERRVDHGSAVQHDEDVAFRHAREKSSAVVSVDLTGLELRVDGVAVPIEVADGPRGAVRVFVPAVEAVTAVELLIPSLGPATTIPFTLSPVRDWTIHVVHHSHFDIGYTDPQAVVLAQQRSFLDSALELLRSTEDAPEETRFRWVVESIFTFEDWAATRPARLVEEFVDYVRRGRAELTALPYNLHTDTCSTDELHELMRTGREIADRYGIRLRAAMQTDVPGTVAGLPDALAENGVEFLAVAHNWAGRSMPQTNGGQLLPRLFRWTAPSGRSVLVWLTDSPHGMAYMEGPLLGFHSGYDDVVDNLPIYLSSLANNPYPFPPGVFGWHGTAQAVDREPYPWNIVHVRTQGFVGDNAPARLQASAIAEQWNATWESPKLRISTNAEFFDDALERYEGEIQSYQGDWGDWWVEGVGSAAYPMTLVRDAQARVTDAQTMAAIRCAVSGEPLPGDAAERREVYRVISMFNEHTWGAGNSWRQSDHGFDSGEVQWQWKVAHAIRAQQDAGQYLERAGAFLAADLGTAEDAVASFYAVNTSGVERDATVRFFVRESTLPFDTGFAIEDGRTGERLPFEIEAQSNHRHRESGRFVSVRVPGLPPVGFVRLDLRLADEVAAAAATGASDPLVIENEHLRVRVDLSRSVIASIVELATGRELLNGDSLFGGNEYIYDLYTSAGGFNHQSNKTSTSAELELLGDRQRARPAALIARESDALEERLVYEFPAKGVEWVRVTLRLRRGEPALLVENRVAKPTTTEKESAFFAFPFSGSDPVVRYEVSGGVTGDGIEHVPGAPQHMRAVRDWVTVESAEGSVAWVTRDAPLVERGTIALPYAPFPASTSPVEPGTILSWLHNNVWDTNFPVQQGFETTFSYAIGVADATSTGASAEQIAIATAATLVTPPVVVQANGTGAAPAEWSLVSVDDPRIRLVGVQALDAERLLVRLQSFTDEHVEAAVRMRVPASAAAAATYFGDELDPLPMDDGVLAVPVPAFTAQALIVRR
ncbi:glycosyl hydrolase family 38 [Diaminobutyricimonas aerilata]|uniref:Glycosyl hydrolase family 38 n=1 Tax=Diaminobutyricimonas aerilata TaxID=1162967 RepID=A0A2M9CHJ8_9MICO|nr:glycoside hydrolase family 38 C-terminal domain-containing protein [Diaminobutyricimonas aerilata]PJJ71350.1 glycosyl hydrolase family 38 [Diaminobutyricimonas aerilata]